MKTTKEKQEKTKKGKNIVPSKKKVNSSESKAGNKVLEPVKKTVKKTSSVVAKGAKASTSGKSAKASTARSSPGSKPTAEKSRKPTKVIVAIKPKPAKKTPKLNKTELSRLKEELFSERARVIKELKNLDSITHTNGDDEIVEVHAYSIHMAECASDIEAVNTALGLRKILIERLNQINDALDRAEEGNYGVCLKCGCAINMERLLAKPQAVFCVSCRRAVEAEKRGVM